MKFTAVLLPVLLPGALLAQPGHWRVSLQGGVARGFNHLHTEPNLPSSTFSIPNRAGASFQLGLERSLTPRFSLRTGFGVVNHRSGAEHRMTVRDTVNNLVFSSVGRSWGGHGYLTGSLGGTLNSRAFGRMIFTAGADVVGRYNLRGDEGGRRWGGRGSMSVGSQRREYVSLFRLEGVPPLTLGVSLRGGFDYRLSERALLSLTATYHRGFGLLRRGVSDTLRFEGIEYRGSFQTRGSHVSLMVGLKYNLFRANPTGAPGYTPYNGPLARSGFDLDERKATFRAGTWLAGLTGSGFYRGSSFGRHLYGLRAGYFALDRTLVGVKAHYLRSNHDWGGEWLTAGPLLRYQFTRTRVSPFVELAYAWGRTWTGVRGAPNFDPRVQYASFAPGLNVRLGPYLRLETALELLSRGNFGWRRGSNFVQIGISHQFGTKLL